LILPDVNVLVAAYREDAPVHAESKVWLDARVNSPAAFGMADRVLEGFVRVVTHPKVFRTAATPEAAISFVESLTGRENCVRVSPGPRQWTLFLELVRETAASGNQVADAWLAALAIDSGSQWITWDQGFARFPNLSWKEPSSDL
jgi:toxin-antitoxin system PIN domain toxin